MGQDDGRNGGQWLEQGARPQPRVAEQERPQGWNRKVDVAGLARRRCRLMCPQRSGGHIDEESKQLL